MIRFGPRPSVAVAALVTWAGSVRAQVDYRNLDEGRPGRVVDATPIERYAFELSLPYRLSWEDQAGRSRVAPHLDYGIGRNLMVGLGLDLPLGGRAGEETEGRISAMWNPRRETISLPAVAVLVEAVGASLGSASVVAGVALTRSFGRSRLHLNGAAALARPEDPSDRTEPTWWAGLGWDLTFLRSSTLVVGEVVVTRPERTGQSEVSIGAGLRKQLTPTLVVHGGFAQGLSTGARETRFTLGLSRAFAIAGLMRGGGR